MEGHVYLAAEKRKAKEDEYIRSKQRDGLPWGTLEFDYLRKDLRADIWDENGNLLPGAED